MNENINLLIKDKEPEKRQSPGLVLFRNIAFGCLFLVLGTAIVLFLLVSLSPLSRLQEDAQRSRIALTSYADNLQKVAVVEDRVKNITSLLSSRFHYDQHVDTIKKEMPEETEITGVKFDAKNLSFNIQAASLAPLDAFLQKLEAMNDTEKKYKTMILSSIAYNNKTNAYVLTIDLTAEK